MLGLGILEMCLGQEPWNCELQKCWASWILVYHREFYSLGELCDPVGDLDDWIWKVIFMKVVVLDVS